MNRLLPVLMLVSLLALPGLAMAQDSAPPGASGEDATAPARRPRVTFAQADTDHDGRLSRSEAEAKPFIAKHFDAIDRNHDGYISRDELRAAIQARRERREQRQAQPATPDPAAPAPDAPPASGP